jgi:eukaryotic-like serine/threonine-protein kinase
VRAIAERTWSRGRSVALGHEVTVGEVLAGMDRTKNAPLRESVAGVLKSFALADPAPLFRLRDFEVWEELGESRLGLTFRGRRPETGEEIHVVDLGDGHLRDVREILAPLRVLDHPNVVGLVDLVEGGEAHGGCAAVFARAGGRELGPWAFALSVDEKLEILIQAARGLEHVHAKGVVHAGLEPPAIRVDGGIARVVDFGATALELLRAEEDPEREPSFRLHGFYAPEVLKFGTRSAAAAADIYGLAAIAAWLFLERPPFSGSEPLGVMKEIVFAAPPPVPVRGPAIARALSKEPAERFESMTSFREALEAGP